MKNLQRTLQRLPRRSCSNGKPATWQHKTRREAAWNLALHCYATSATHRHVTARCVAPHTLGEGQRATAGALVAIGLRALLRNPPAEREEDGSYTKTAHGVADIGMDPAHRANNFALEVTAEQTSKRRLQPRSRHRR